MPDWPAGLLFVLLAVVVFLRAGATYVLARGARGLTDRRVDLASRPGVQRAEDVVRRLGPAAVVLSFLTIGVQTAVQAAAGGLRMPLVRYLPALVLGSLVWAAIYVTVGLAAVEAWWGGRWWVLPLTLAGLGAAAWVVSRWLLRGRTPTSGGPPPGRGP